MSDSQLATIDSMIQVASSRGMYTVADVEEFDKALETKGFNFFKFVSPLIDRVRQRTYVSNGEVVDVLLDIRNVISPPTETPSGENTTTKEQSNG